MTNDLMRNYHARPVELAKHLNKLLNVVCELHPIIFYLYSDDVENRITEARIARKQPPLEKRSIQFWKERAAMDQEVLPLLNVDTSWMDISNGQWGTRQFEIMRRLKIVLNKNTDKQETDHNGGVRMSIIETFDHDHDNDDALRNLNEYVYITLRDRPGLIDQAAAWFHEKWRVPTEAYLECMTAYLNRETEYGWYLCLDGERIVGGVGVIENDFHDRKDLAPNVCAVYTEEAYRCKGIAGRLLNMAVEDMRAKDITPLYLVTDHVGFYERYGWEFLCMVQGDGEPDMTRMYIHR